MAVNEQNFNFAQTGDEYADEVVRLHNASEDAHPDLRAELEVCNKALENTVQKENGMGLSANDYSDEDKEKLRQAVAGVSGLTAAVQNLGKEVGKKVGQVDGMGLSSNDFTDLDKEAIGVASKTAKDSKTLIDAHVKDTVIHVKNEERQAWNAATKQAKAAEDAALKAVRMGVSVTTLDSGDDATVLKTDNGEQITLEFGIPRGENGAKGDKGDNGYTPQKGVDYYTEEEKEELVQVIADEVTGGIETALDNIIAIQNSLIGGGSV